MVFLSIFNRRCGMILQFGRVFGMILMSTPVQFSVFHQQEIASHFRVQLSRTPFLLGFYQSSNKESFCAGSKGPYF